jgi:hypothetical protein
MSTPRFEPTPQQREIANSFSRNAQLMARGSTLQRLFDAAGKRFSEPRIGQLVAHVAVRQAELGRAVVDDFRQGRFGAATVLVRSMLETTAWAAWPIAHASDAEQRRRLIRLLLEGYRDALDQGLSIPPDAKRLLQTTTGKAAAKPPSFKDILGQLDALEAKTPGGIPFWVSHADHYDLASDYTHPTFAGSLSNLVDLEPMEWLGINALTHGHQYLALTGATCAVLADLPELKAKIEARYGQVAKAQHAARASAGI